MTFELSPDICSLKQVISATSFRHDSKTSGMKRLFAIALQNVSLTPAIIKKKPNLSSHSKALILTLEPDYTSSES